MSAASAAGLPAAATNQAPNDSDAGPAADASAEVTLVAAASFASVSLLVPSANCAAGRCRLAGTATTSFYPVTPARADYILMYETAFRDLRAGSTCTAEIVEGSWLVFAGNIAVESGLPRWDCVRVEVRRHDQGHFIYADAPQPHERGQSARQLHRRHAVSGGIGICVAFEKTLRFRKPYSR